MSFKHILIVALCLVALFIALSFKETHFDYIRSSDAVLVVKDKPVSILFIGDVMLGRNVENLMKLHGEKYPFTYVDSMLASTDAVVANLEGPIMNTSVHTPSGSFHFSFPATTPKILEEHHIGIITLANNHTYDFGVSGYTDTVSLLDKSSIAHFGHPFAFNETYVLRKEIGGRKFIFVGFNATNPKFDTEGAKAFIAQLPRNDETLIVAVHGGTEYNLHSTTYQQNLYRGFIDAGADLVIAHHPHVVEEIEQYKNKLIFYSLGNFIFDQYFSKDVQEMIAVKTTFTDNVITFKLIPLKSNKSQPMVMSDKEKAAWLKTLSERSDPKLSDAIKNGEILLSY